MRKYCLLAAVVLAGCQGAPGSPAWFAQTSQDQQIAFFQKRCQAYGFQAGTTAMAQCIQNDANAAKGRALQRVLAMN